MDAMRDGAGNVAVQNPPPVMGDDEEAIEHAESQRRHGEEVHRGDRFSVVIQESSPTLRRLWISWGLSHPAQYRSRCLFASRVRSFYTER
jgi:hypothetical protein